ncbi:double-strand-break repair protein rad21-like protein 1 [Scleropages formosus]|uniref:double-strand-break repair protein rad21-like protein 1 n=1 Tax=Scleropages formosus TaxID=113540 RepID=UPI000878117A|nr:double-strand-break repair protein rad21 homolog A-like [Scleropages formosus]
MFDMQLFTSKRGPLAKIWLAAHWDKKITKTHVFECNLETTVMDIISPQIKIGLRTSGHLLLGVVRIYSRKTKYLLADCSEAIVKIRVAFRPGQTDLPSENTEAPLNTITLPENFTDFELQLPDASVIDVVDHFTLNQSRSEDITMKEDYGNSFLVLESDFGNKASLQQGGMFDGSFHSLPTHTDGFGDEEGTFDFLDFMASSGEDIIPTDFSSGCSKNNIPPTPPPTAEEKEAECVETASWPDGSDDFPAMDETTLVENLEEAFALEPVSITSTLEKKRDKRKRRLVVDREKELSSEAIQKQLADCFDLVAPLEMAPPTRQLIEWKETGGVHWLLRHSCVPLVHPQLQQCIMGQKPFLPSQLFPGDMFPGRWKNMNGIEELDPEEMRAQQEENDECISLHEEHPSLLTDLLEPEVTEHSTDHTPLGPPVERSSPPLDSQDLEEKKINSRVQNLLHILQEQRCRGASGFHLSELCQGGNRTHLAATFFCLLVLHKQRVLELRQEVAYGDIVATPGPRFSQL